MNTEIRVSALFIAKSQGEPMTRVAQAKAIEGTGLEGDRYSRGAGFWQTVPKPRETVRQVSLISKDTLDRAGFDPEMSRRNVIIDGDIDFRRFIGKEFSVGEVILRGVELCTPCNRPSKLSGVPGFEKLSPEDGGLRAEILTTGIIYENDAVVIPEESV